jgi:hypothetical protein
MMKKFLSAALLFAVCASPLFAAKKAHHKPDYRYHTPKYKYKAPKSHNHFNPHNARKHQA